MPTSLEQEIRDAVMNYISGAMPLRHFKKWFASATWNVGADNDLRRLVSEIELLLAEFSNGDWTENELKRNLQQYRRFVQLADVADTIAWTEVRPPYVYTVTNGSGGFDTNIYFAGMPLTIGSQMEESASAA